MHFAFIPYGKLEEVELLLRDMRAQKHLLRMTKGKDIKGIHIQGQVRLLPFGIYEYVFPKEDKDLVLNTLIGNVNGYNLPKSISYLIKKALKLEPIPDYNTDKQFLWIKQNVQIIPLGIRPDGEIEDLSPDFKGYTHEAI